MKHIKEFEEFINEGLWSNIMKGVNLNDIGPWSIVAIENKKVIGQVNNIKIKDLIPAKFEEIKKEYKNAIFHIENGEGLVVWSSKYGPNLVKESFNKSSLVDYSKSKNKILVGIKTDLLRNMKDRYDYKEDGDNIYFFDKGKHIGTLFDLGSRFQELRHDGNLNDNGWRINEDLDSTVSDPEIEKAWEEIYGHPLKHDHPSMFKILKQRPSIDSRELDRIWSEAFDKTFKEQHPRVWDILFSETKE